MGKFAIKPTNDGKYMFNLIANNNQVICTSQTYTSVANCKVGAESVRKNSAVDVEDQTVEGYEVLKNPKYEMYTDAGGKYRFRLKASNGEIVRLPGVCRQGVLSQGHQEHRQPCARRGDRGDRTRGVRYRSNQWVEQGRTRVGSSLFDPVSRFRS